MLEQKKFVDIEQVRFEDVILHGEVTRKNNVEGFKVGDHIQVSTKIDGSNASCEYDAQDNEVKCFSRNLPLKSDEGLMNFPKFIKEKNIKGLKDHPNWLVFGEWFGNQKRSQKISYDKEMPWTIYSIWDREKGQYLKQDIVKQFAQDNDIDYIEVLYDGPFISWDHIKTFLHASKYGPVQEGVVIRNLTRMDDPIFRMPHIVKWVNDDFRESMIKAPKVVDPKKESEKQKAGDLIAQVVTKNRIEKMLSKLQDEGILGKQLTDKDMRVIAQNLPKRIWEDINKEEPEVVKAAGDYASKLSGSLTMAIARKIILGV